ncbi:Transcription factor [Kickxella alabastrina]|nr:Transcription factor [Kickxella alabastrina]
MSCDDKRPCQRCIRRNIPHMCRDKDITAESSEVYKGAKKTAREGKSRLPKRDTEAVPIAPAGPVAAVAAITSSDSGSNNNDNKNSSINDNNNENANSNGNGSTNGGGRRDSSSAIINREPALQQTTSSDSGLRLPALSGTIASHTNMPLSIPSISMSQPYLSNGASTTAHSLPIPSVAPTALPMLSARSNSTSAGAVNGGSLPQVTLQASLSGTSGEATRALGDASGGRPYAGTRFDSNSLLLFGNDVASNEFSALNEFLESLQRGMRNGERFDPDLRLSNPPSSSPTGPPSQPGAGSPVAESTAPSKLPASNSAHQFSQFQQAHMHVQAQAQLQAQLQAQVQAQVQAQAQAHAHAQAQAQAQVQAHAHAQLRSHSLPTISQMMDNGTGEGVTQTERFLLTAADPNDGTSEDKLRQIINAKYEAGILKPYKYANGYVRMQRFMETNISRSSIIRIFEVLNTFRPTFRSIAQALTDIDLLLVEEGFERLLLDYDNVFNSFGVPACLWRRTGEIYKANREFADLVGVPLSYFHEGRVCIYELMSETSTVNYWEKYGEIAFDATQKAVLTTCVLQTAASIRSMVRTNSAAKRIAPSSGSGSGFGRRSAAAATHSDQPSPSQPSNPVRCCFSFTLRRDKYKIPLAIAGNFMPIQQ